MKKLNQLENYKGGICRFFPTDNHPASADFACFNVWLCTVTGEVTGGGISCLLD